MNENQGKSDKQIEDSNFFFGLALAGIISLFIWYGIYKLMSNV